MYLELITEKPTAVTRRTPVLFVHGMWHGAWCWAEHFLPYFSQHGYISCALNLRSHGASEGPKQLRWISLKNYISDLVQIASQMDTPPVLVGHSSGGLIVQKYMEQHKAAAAVLLASTPPKGALPATLRTFLRHPLTVIKAFLTLSVFPIVSTPGIAEKAFFSTDIPKEKLAVYVSQLQDDSFRAYLDLLRLNFACPKKVEVPLLVLGAENDMIISQNEVRATAHAYNVEAHIFPDMAHDMMLETNWQQVADHILAWMNNRDM
jgi:alpha-beta hydrolase superfamily lysophospholipase